MPKALYLPFFNDATIHTFAYLLLSLRVICFSVSRRHKSKMPVYTITANGITVTADGSILWSKHSRRPTHLFKSWIGWATEVQIFSVYLDFRVPITNKAEGGYRDSHIQSVSAYPLNNWILQYPLFYFNFKAAGSCQSHDWAKDFFRIVAICLKAPRNLTYSKTKWALSTTRRLVIQWIIF